jgi:hypothetical protein
MEDSYLSHLAGRFEHYWRGPTIGPSALLLAVLYFYFALERERGGGFTFGTTFSLHLGHVAGCLLRS